MTYEHHLRSSLSHRLSRTVCQSHLCLAFVCGFISSLLVFSLTSRMLLAIECVWVMRYSNQKEKQAVKILIKTYLDKKPQTSSSSIAAARLTLPWFRFWCTATWGWVFTTTLRFNQYSLSSNHIERIFLSFLNEPGAGAQLTLTAALWMTHGSW